MTKKTVKTEWNTWETLPENGESIIVKMNTDNSEHSAVIDYADGTVFAIFDGGVLDDARIYDLPATWKLKPADPISNETKPNKSDLMDTKKISNEMAQRWFTEKILEEFGTVAVDLQLNNENIIVYYNAGVVKK